MEAVHQRGCRRVGCIFTMGAIVIFPGAAKRIFLDGEPNVVKFHFSHSKLIKKKLYFAENVIEKCQNSRGAKSPFRRPCTRDCELKR